MKFKHFLFLGAFSGLVVSCGNSKTNPDAENDTDLTQSDSTKADEFEYLAEKFADLKVIRYKIPSWDNLSLQQKKYAYYLTQAGYAGREIIYDQNYRHNLAIKRALEKVYTSYEGDKTTEEWKNLEIYLKQIWAHNGIHHHYSNDKHEVNFSKAFLVSQLDKVNAKLSEEALKAIFDPSYDAKKVNKAEGVDVIKESAVNMYSPNLTQQEVKDFYKGVVKKGKRTLSYGINSKLVKNESGEISEEIYKVGGLYSEAIEKVIFWLEKAVEVSENEAQAHALQLLIEYYKTGSLKLWDEYNVAWAQATEGDVDYINSFIEVYNDPIGKTGSYETIVEIKDFEMTEIMSVLADNVQWFEDNSSIDDKFKKDSVKGVTYKVVDVAGEAGDASPFTPIGVNLPNSNWIRSEIGSKSVSLGNIISAYDGAAGKGSEALKEFAYSEEEIERSKKHSKVAGKMHTALHEVVGHASGKMNDGVTKDDLLNYSSTLEEARADLVGLYYIMDQKLVDLGLIESLEVGKAEYDGYIRNGLMVQLKRLKLGKDIEEDHMRNRQLVAAWAMEKGADDNVVEKVTKDGKTYFKVNDYMKLRGLFGELLKEIQRIKSEGDFEAGRDLVEKYGVKVNQDLHKEVLDRYESLNILPYGIFINPKIVPVKEDDKIVDFKIEYQDFTEQMLEYADKYAYLPDYN